MYRVRKKIKGFTMLELILALAIGAMFSAIFFQFFFIHQKALNSVAIKSELQMNMQYSMDFFTKSAMETSCISTLNDTNPDALYMTQTLGQIGITFLVKNEDTTLQYTYKYRVVDNNLYYTPPGLAERIICSDISRVQITPIDAKSFSECSGIIVEIDLIGEDGKTPYTMSNSMYFRNK